MFIAQCFSAKSFVLTDDLINNNNNTFKQICLSYLHIFESSEIDPLFTNKQFHVCARFNVVDYLPE